ncbi:MAG: carbohydrate ABC transporter permease [Spirochaetales bacterium]|nr:carbohydrate ABC transporter permease [Spirochaetales bacterium]
MAKTDLQKNLTSIGIKIIFYVIFFTFTILTILPLVWLFYSSFKPKAEIVMNPLALPKNFIITNYIQAWTIGKLGLYTINSLFYTSVSTIVSIVFAMGASFAFAKLRYKITVFFYNLFLMGLLISIHSILVPLFLAETWVHLQDTHLGILIPYIALALPVAIYLGTEYIKGIPDSLIESSRMDGAGYFRIFAEIVFPMCMPVVMTVAILTILGCWNEFILVFILTSSESTRSLPVGIYAFSGPLAIEYGLQFAALVIGAAPMILFYAFFNRQITKGFAAGAIKG